MKKSILFFAESLDGGGAEGALENVIKNLDRSKFDISVVSETDHEGRTERIAAMSKYHCFGHKNINNSKVREIINRFIFKFSVAASPSLVRKTLVRGKYDIEVAACEGYATKLIGLSGKRNCKKIAWVHTDFVNNPWSVEAYADRDEEKACYENFDAIICVSETIKDSFVKTYGCEDKVKVLYNIVDNYRIQELGSEKLDKEPTKPMFVMAGSFLKVKGYERAVRVYSRLRDDGFDFSVLIMGMGYERENVEKVIEETDMGDRITLMNYQSNPFKYMAAANAYVCSSYAEGYSTTVTESVILGTPIITTECSGMREIFGDRECGIICENSDDGLYEALKKVLENPELFEKYRKEAEARSEYFKKEKLVGRIENLFETI